MIGLLVLAQLVAVAHAPDTASACAPVDVTVAARAPGAVPPRISMGSAAGVQFLRSTEATRIDRTGAGMTALTEATFVIAARGTGRISLPVFTASAGALRTTASPGAIAVHAQQQELAPSVLVRASLDRGGRPTDTLFVGEQVDYVVDVYLNEPARQRLRRNPTFFPPEMPGVLAYDLEAPTGVTRTGRRCYETLSYRRALFPLFAGRSSIAPAALTYSLPLSTSFFSREETFELRTDSVRFVSRDVPAERRPAAFTGAVGAVSATSRLSAPRTRMGDPVVLTLRIEGTGNVKLWPRPAVRVPWGSVADGGERVVVDTTQARVRGSKEFDWLVTPRLAGRREVPAIQYPYFDVDRTRYDSAAAPPLTLDVASGALAAVDTTPASRLGIRRSLRPEVPPPLTDRAWFWLALVAAPLPAAFRGASRARRQLAQRQAAARRLRNASERGSSLDARELRLLLLACVAERVPDATGVSRPDAVERTLRLNGVTATTAAATGAMLRELESAAFSGAGSLAAPAVRAVDGLVAAIDREAEKPASKWAVGVATGMLMVVALLAANAALPSGTADTFAQGVRAYDDRGFATSQHLFGRVVSRAPRSEDAWANLGAAAWARGDSAAAGRAWQRALRLDPLDDETRDRLSSVQSSAIRSPGYVAPVPVNALAAAALVVWLAAWAIFTLQSESGVQRRRALSGGAMTLGVLLVLASLEARDRLDVRGLAVLRDSRRLVDAPGSVTSTGSASAGETGVVGAREGPWVRIVFDGTRAGWVPGASVLPLDAPPLGD